MPPWDYTVNHNCKGDKAARKLARAAERANAAKARAEYAKRLAEHRPGSKSALTLLAAIAALEGSRV